MSSDTTELPAFAKINLSLEILGRRRDAYTEIRTVYQTLNLHDRLRLRLRRRGGVSVRVPRGGAPEGRRNLAHRAIAEGCRLTGWRGGVELEIEKWIPPARGLGGGSSDAAVAVMGLFRLLRLQPPRTELQRLCARLGSDVPFFLFGGCALGVSRGEEVFPLPEFSPRWCVLVCPPFEISTTTAYRWASRGGRLTAPAGPVTIRRLGRFQGRLWAAGNDFESVVFPRFPVLGRMCSTLRKAGAEQAGLSGSGSTVYGLFNRRAQARRAARAVAEAGATFLVETLSAEQYRRALGWEFGSP